MADEVNFWKSQFKVKLFNLQAIFKMSFKINDVFLIERMIWIYRNQKLTINFSNYISVEIKITYLILIRAKLAGISIAWKQDKY